MVLTSGLAGAQERLIATVNGEKITSGEITKKLWWQYSAQALSDIIEEDLILEQAAKLKVGHDATEAQKRFDNLAAGYKDKAEFEKSLKAVGWTTEDLKKLIRRQLITRNTIIAAKGITATDAQVQELYEKNKDKLGTTESAKLRQIFVATKAEADEAHQILAAGADFAKLSALRSADENLKKKEGDIGEISKAQLLPEIAKEVFALKPGQYTNPIASGGGYSIFKVESLKPAEPAKLTPEIKASLKASIMNQAITEKLPEYTNELRKNAKIDILK